MVQVVKVLFDIHLDDASCLESSEEEQESSTQHKHIDEIPIGPHDHNVFLSSTIKTMTLQSPLKTNISLPYRIHTRQSICTFILRDGSWSAEFSKNARYGR